MKKRSGSFDDLDCMSEGKREEIGKMYTMAQRYFDIGKEAGAEAGAKAALKQVTLNLLKEGLDPELITRAVQLDTDRISELVRSAAEKETSEDPQ